jgi:hypothetical protein
VGEEKVGSWGIGRMDMWRKRPEEGGRSIKTLKSLPLLFLSLLPHRV